MSDGTTGFFGRRITLRWALILLILVILAGLVLWALKAFELRRVTSTYDSTLRTRAAQTAQVSAESIAVFGNRQIVQRDWGALQDAADELVTQKPLAYIAITDARGIAVVHTDRSMRGKKLPKQLETDGLAHARVPAMSMTRQAGTVWVGVNLVRMEKL